MKPAIDSLKTHRKNGTNGKTDFFYLSQQLVHGINVSVKKQLNIKHTAKSTTGDFAVNNLIVGVMRGRNNQPRRLLKAKDNPVVRADDAVLFIASIEPLLAASTSLSPNDCLSDSGSSLSNSRPLAVRTASEK